MFGLLAENPHRQSRIWCDRPSFAWHSVAKHWFLGLPNIQTVSGLQGVAILDYAELPTASFVCIHGIGDMDQQESDPLVFAVL